MRMVQHVVDRKNETKFERSRGFIVRYMWADHEFEPLSELLLSTGLVLYIIGANEHVSLKERDVRAVKQRYRAIRHGLPYTTMSSLMAVHLVMYIYF